MCKGKIISTMPKINNNRIDWLSTRGMDIIIQSYEYGIKTFKILNVYRDGKYTFLSLELDGKYVGDVDSSLILKGNIGVLIGKISPNKYKRFFKYNNKYS